MVDFRRELEKYKHVENSSRIMANIIYLMYSPGGNS